MAPESQAIDRNQLFEESEQETMADATAGGEGGDVQIIEPSPTNFSYDHMPKTIGGRAFIRATEQSFQARVLINKLIDKADIKVREMASLEAEREEGDSEDEDYLLVQRDLLDDHEQMRASLKEHFRVSHEIEQMASLIIRERPEIAVKGDRIKEEAQQAREKNVKDQKEISEKVAQWK